MSNFEAMRKNMVDCQLRPCGLADPLLIDAFLDISREGFVPRQLKHIAYMDAPLSLEHDRLMIPPALLARLLQEARIKPGHRVLYVGAHTGYGPALLASFCQKVIALESDSDLARMAQANLSELGFKNVLVLHQALTEGYAPEAPYDAIIIEGAVEVLDPTLLSQLKEGGHAVQINEKSQCVVITRQGEIFDHHPFLEASVPFLPEFTLTKNFEF